jgi:hypothetical protein
MPQFHRAVFPHKPPAQFNGVFCVLAIICLCWWTGCTTRQVQADPKLRLTHKTEIEDAGKPRVQEKWQRAFLQYLGEIDSTKLEAWAVLTYSGWSDAGQFFFVHGDKNDFFYQVPENYHSVARNSKTPVPMPERSDEKSPWILERSKWANFEKSVSAEKKNRFASSLGTFMALEDLKSSVFDGMEIEFVHVQRRGKGLVVDKRVFMHSPNREKSPAHWAAFDGFLSAVKLK